MKFIEKLSDLLSLQLFLFLLSLPILISWGLPVSIMVLIATPIFGPFLTIFLFISTLIFICVLCSIPYSLLVIPLNWCTQIWDFCLSYSTKQWLVYFAMPPKIFMIFIGIINTGILLKFLQFSPRKRFFLLCFYTIFILLFFWGYARVLRHSTYVFTSKKGKLEIICQGQRIILIDHNYFSQKNDYNDWIQYTLIPTFAKKTGNIKIDAIIVKQLSNRTIAALETISKHCLIQHIIVPENSFFSSCVDKLTNCCVILTCVKESHIFFAHNNYSICFKYDQKRERLII